MSLNSDMNLRRDIFQALADPKRRSILVLLAAQSMTAGAIANEIDGARSTISKHIQILSECGLVDAKAEGREIHYQLHYESLSQIDLWMSELREIYEARLDRLDTYLITLQKQNTPHGK